jgi:sulfotransferase family protein
MTARQDSDTVTKPSTDWVLTFAKAFLTPGIRRWIRQWRRPGRFQTVVRPTDVFLVGHPKSGNTWMAYMLGIVLQNDRSGRVTVSNVGRFVPYIHGQDWRIEEHWQLHDPRVFRNECPVYPELYPKTIYLIRDPRAVLVSFYDMYKVVSNDSSTSFDSFITQYLASTGIFEYWNRGLQRWDRQVTTWVERARLVSTILTVRYEDLVNDRAATLSRILVFAGVPFDADDLSTAIARGSFQAMKENEAQNGAEAYRGEAGQRGRFIRRGITDGWKEEMPHHLARKIEEVFAPAMATAGYLS